jgi:hypothetical protein
LNKILKLSVFRCKISVLASVASRHYRDSFRFKKSFKIRIWKKSKSFRIVTTFNGETFKEKCWNLWPALERYISPRKQKFFFVLALQGEDVNFPRRTKQIKVSRLKSFHWFLRDLLRWGEKLKRNCNMILRLVRLISSPLHRQKISTIFFAACQTSEL